MTWGEFKEIFMGKFFLASTRYEKPGEFLELKQGSMTMLEYISKFTELAHFGDDYVAADMAKVRKFKDGLKLSIRGKIIGFLLQDMDSMVRIAMAIEREIEDAQIIQDAGTSSKRNEDQPSSSFGKKQKTTMPRGPQGRGHGYQGQGQTRASRQSEPMICFHCHQLGHVRQD